MEFTPKAGEEAGLVILQSEMASVRFVVMEENGKSPLPVYPPGRHARRSAPGKPSRDGGG